jgi:hypothetical protein
VEARCRRCGSSGLHRGFAVLGGWASPTEWVTMAANASWTTGLPDLRARTAELWKDGRQDEIGTRLLKGIRPMGQPARKTDARLLGTWRSDRRRTLQDWIWPPRTGEKVRKRLSAAFGHLILRYTRTRIYSDLKGFQDTETYEILGADSNSVAIVVRGPLPEQGTIYHIHFEGDRHYWISLGRQREWFRRVEPR